MTNTSNEKYQPHIESLNDIAPNIIMNGLYKSSFTNEIENVSNNGNEIPINSLKSTNSGTIDGGTQQSPTINCNNKSSNILKDQTVASEKPCAPGL